MYIYLVSYYYFYFYFCVAACCIGHCFDRPPLLAQYANAASKFVIVVNIYSLRCSGHRVTSRHSKLLKSETLRAKKGRAERNPEVRIGSFESRIRALPKNFLKHRGASRFKSKCTHDLWHVPLTMHQYTHMHPSCICMHTYPSICLHYTSRRPVGRSLSESKAAPMGSNPQTHVFHKNLFS